MRDEPTRGVTQRKDDSPPCSRTVRRSARQVVVTNDLVFPAAVATEPSPCERARGAFSGRPFGDSCGDCRSAGTRSRGERARTPTGRRRADRRGCCWREQGPARARRSLIATLAAEAAAESALRGGRPTAAVDRAAGGRGGRARPRRDGRRRQWHSSRLIPRQAPTEWQMWRGEDGLVGAWARSCPRLPLRSPASAGVAFDSGDGVGVASAYTQTWQRSPPSTRAVGSTSRMPRKPRDGRRGPELRRLLERYARRLRAEVVWA